jgi:hypothetical protein
LDGEETDRRTRQKSQNHAVELRSEWRKSHARH